MSCTIMRTLREKGARKGGHRWHWLLCSLITKEEIELTKPLGSESWQTHTERAQNENNDISKYAAVEAKQPQS